MLNIYRSLSILKLINCSIYIQFLSLFLANEETFSLSPQRWREVNSKYYSQFKWPIRTREKPYPLVWFIMELYICMLGLLVRNVVLSLPFFWEKGIVVGFFVLCV